MTMFAAFTAALALLCVWLSVHHAWVAWRRPDLCGHGAFAALAAATVLVSLGDCVIQGWRTPEMVRLGDRLIWIGLLIGGAMLALLIGQVTQGTLRWIPRFFVAAQAALGVLWVLKPHGFSSQQVGMVIERQMWWGESVVRVEQYVDWSYLLAVMVAGPLLLWGMGASGSAWLRERAGHGLGLAISLLIVLVAVAANISADLFGFVSPLLISHSFVALAMVMSHLLMREVVRAAELDRRLRLAERFEHLGRLASGVAHDFGNVLNVISMAEELLRRHLPEDPDTGRLLDVLRSGCQRGQALNQRLTRYAAGGQGQRARLDVHQSIREVELLVISRSIRIATRLDAYDHHVLGDPAQLTSLLLNLAVNAADAMPDGGTITITTADRSPTVGMALRHPLRGSRHVELAVGDQGIGIPVDVLDRMWEPWFTTKGARGTGLGMAQIDDAVRGLDGTIAVETQVGRGTIFRIWIPIAITGSSAHLRAVEAAAATVWVVGEARSVAELQAAALAPRLTSPVRAADASSRDELVGGALVVDVAVAGPVLAALPGMPAVVIGASTAPLQAGNRPLRVLPSGADATTVATAVEAVLAARATHATLGGT